MGLLSEPIFYKSLRKDSGSKRKMIQINNTEETKIVATVSDMEKPEWLELEGIYPGAQLEFKRKAKRQVIVNINTNHRYFPEAPVRDEKVKLTLNCGELGDVVIDIGITIPEIIATMPDFRGVFAVDFGTTNSCYAHKGSSAGGGSESTSVSKEIPTLIFFHDVSDNFNPSYTVGTDARRDITENSSQVYSYVMSIKRRLGMNKSITMLDKLSGARPDHRQEWHVEEVASFILRDLISRAEDELEKRITKNIVATFPPLFSMDRKLAIRNTFHRAFRDLKKPLSEDNLVMILDEANAAAFNYIYRVMLQELRDFRISKPGDREWIRANLLSYDFGGGTIDISVVYVEIERVEGGRIEIRTELKGVSGEANYGGDNVTLTVFLLLKTKIAQVIAKTVLVEIKKQEETAAAAAKEKAAAANKAVDIWASLAAGGDDKEDEGGDVWGEDGEDGEKKPVEEVEAPIDPEFEGLDNHDISSMKDDSGKDIKGSWVWGGEYEQAIRTVIEYQPVLARRVDTGRPLVELMIAYQKEKNKYSGEGEAKREAERLDKAIETLVPTRSARYENENPKKEIVAQRLFQELWQEADLLKIRCAVSSLEKENESKKNGAEPAEVQKAIWNASSTITSSLKRIAHYAKIDSLHFNDVEVSMEMIEHWIEDAISASVKKGHALFKGISSGLSGAEAAEENADASSGSESVGGLSLKPKTSSGLKLKIGGASGGDSDKPSGRIGSGADVKLRVLLFGNSSNLPIVRRKFFEIFKNDVDQSNLIFDPVNLKSAVASGACEEYTLRKIFGGGLIKYSPAGFLSKLPYSYGLYHRDLEFAGFERGYAPIFDRGDKIGKTVLLSESKFFMVNATAPDLAVFSNYKDGADFSYVGFFDFQKKDGFDDVCAHLKAMIPPPPDQIAGNVAGKSIKEIQDFINEASASLPPHMVEQIKEYLMEVKLWTLDDTLFDKIGAMVDDVVTAGERASAYRVAMHLLPTREVLCIKANNVNTLKSHTADVFLLRVKPFDIDKVENPFSGNW